MNVVSFFLLRRCSNLHTYSSIPLSLIESNTNRNWLVLSKNLFKATQTKSIYTHNYICFSNGLTLQFYDLTALCRRAKKRIEKASFSTSTDNLLDT